MSLYSLKLVDIEEVEKRKKKYTRQELIEKIQQWTREHNGIPPKQEDFTNNPRYPGFVTIKREFETWNNGLEAAGFEVNVMTDCSREKLIEKMKQFERENRRSPTERDFKNNPRYPSCMTYVNEFGSWIKALTAAGFKPNDKSTRGRLGEVQTLSEFKTGGAVDLSGDNRRSICDGICPKGELYDVKSSSLVQSYRGGAWGWYFGITEEQLQQADYLFLRAYEDKDFAKPPKYKWRVPIELAECRKGIFIYKDENRGIYNVKNMKEYEI